MHSEKDRPDQAKAENSVETHDSVKMKLKPVGKVKPTLEGKGGDDLHRATGKWMHLERTIDRENDQYKEVVTDP